LFEREKCVADFIVNIDETNAAALLIDGDRRVAQDQVLEQSDF